MTIRMWTRAMTRAREAWEDQADALHGPLRNLADANPGLLGSRVGPVAASFLATWETQVATLRTSASGHADDLAGAAHDMSAADAASVQAVQDLLLWDDRDAAPLSYGATP